MRLIRTMLVMAMIAGGTMVLAQTATTAAKTNAVAATNAAQIAAAGGTNAAAARGEAESPAPEGGQFSMIKRLQATGKTGLFQLLISIVSLSFVLERLFNLRASRITPDGLSGEARRLWASGDFKGVAALNEKYPSTLGRVIAGLVEHRQATAADATAYAGDIAGREMKRHLLRAYPMVVAATLETLLGLFGTVLGMVGAFEAVALAGKMGDPSIMAEDISFALMTTVVGLLVAVPSLAAYHFFRIRTNILALNLEEEVSELIADWFMKRETPQ